MGKHPSINEIDGKNRDDEQAVCLKEEEEVVGKAKKEMVDERKKSIIDMFGKKNQLILILLSFCLFGTMIYKGCLLIVIGKAYILWCENVKNNCTSPKSFFDNFFNNTQN